MRIDGPLHRQPSGNRSRTAFTKAICSSLKCAKERRDIALTITQLLGEIRTALKV